MGIVLGKWDPSVKNKDPCLQDAYILVGKEKNHTN